jgi:large subunit ribosomal protein L2
MGKRIIVRARGHGGPRYLSPGHRFVSPATYRFTKAVVVDIVHDPCRDEPLAKLKTEQDYQYIIAAEGMKVGDIVDKEGEVRSGNVLPLHKIPKGATIFAIENYPGSGPKLCCAAGSRSIIIANDPGRIIIQMPSKEFKTFNPNCLATVGISAGGGRHDKPFVKAGQMYLLAQTRNKIWQKSSAVKQNPVDHPFGGHTKPGTPKTVSRLMPPGAKVGSISARRSGLKKK